MEKLVTKFVVAAENTIADLCRLGRAVSMEQYAGLVRPEVLEQYIAARYHEKALTDSINNFSNQWLMTYAGEEAVGFACLGTKGKKPAAIQDVRSIGITHYGMLQAFSKEPQLPQKLVELGGRYAAMWLAVYAESPLAGHFEKLGFRKGEAVQQGQEGLPLPFVYLLKA
ncbi:hypothetical protein [Chitinophaga alhagiae]|uniref:hypothetical protein n=1 Tax=Chitinophaga alhagiae TaxID=2203219 RepID=UPI000E5AF8B6|nr:hypothetical protein [Chitinophaga alhagiae]